jgi:hypothetical protein
MWWAWARKVGSGPDDQLWIGWLELSKMMDFGLFKDKKNK